MNRRGILMMTGIVLLFPQVSSAADEEFRPLFSGKDLSGWAAVDCKEGTWKAENGELIVEKAEGGWLRTDREYKNFILKLEFNLTPGGNSGVFLRAPLAGNPAFQGLEIQVLDHFHEMYHKAGAEIHAGQYTGSVYDLVPASNQRVLKSTGEWNSYEIAHIGDRIKVVLNGTTIIDTNLEEQRHRIGEHPGVGRKQGFIGLQSHGSKVRYRGISVKELD